MPCHAESRRKMLSLVRRQKEVRRMAQHRAWIVFLMGRAKQGKQFRAGYFK